MALFREVKGDTEGCFMKLSSRSAKDVALAWPKTFEIYEQLLPKYLSEQFQTTDVSQIAAKELCNTRLSCLYEAMTLSMKVHTPKEGLDLLMQSRRIYWDLKYAQVALAAQKIEREKRGDPDCDDSQLAAPVGIVVREWASIPLCFEFRAFVYQNKLTAVSQYFTQLYFPTLATLRDQLQSEITEFWHKIAHHFEDIKNLPDPAHVETVGTDPIVKYVIDFALISKSIDLSDPDRHWVVLEINPFNISTGPALFNWESESDCQILFGQSPFEFRLLDAPVAHTLRNKLHPEWRDKVFLNIHS